MDNYDHDELYAAIADELFVSRRKARTTGGRQNIRATGDGPERAVRNLISGLIGAQYRVTHGHVVRADGLKSKQIDIIVVRDLPAATLHIAEDDETELVRVEWVAAVGEVKASWYNHSDVIESYRQMVTEIDELQDGRLVANKIRFGEMGDDTTIDAMTRPITGREWANRCYTFLLTLGQGNCRIPQLENDLKSSCIRSNDASALILDKEIGATICIPARLKSHGVSVGVFSDYSLKSEESSIPMTWVTFQEKGFSADISCGRLLHYFITDLQLHLGTWYAEYVSAKDYSKLSKELEHRHANERRST